MYEYVGILASFALAAVIAGGMIVLASTLGKKKPSDVKSEPFECGKNPISLPGGKMAIKFYLTAILFILFDVELVFLYPWAVVFREMVRESALIFWEMLIFVGVLALGYAYVWRKGGLDWD